MQISGKREEGAGKRQQVTLSKILGIKIKNLSIDGLHNPIILEGDRRIKA